MLTVSSVQMECTWVPNMTDVKMRKSRPSKQSRMRRITVVGGEKELHSEREGTRPARGSTLPPAPQDRAPRWPPGPRTSPRHHELALICYAITARASGVACFLLPLSDVCPARSTPRLQEGRDFLFSLVLAISLGAMPDDKRIWARGRGILSFSFPFCIVGRSRIHEGNSAPVRLGPV